MQCSFGLLKIQVKKKKKTKNLFEQVSGCLARFYEDPLTKSRKIVENLYFFK
jgi:hypothetical protein